MNTYLAPLLAFYTNHKSIVLWFSAGILLFLSLQFGGELFGLLLAPLTLLIRAKRVAKAAEVLDVLDSLRDAQDTFEEELAAVQTDESKTRAHAEREADEWLDR